MAITHDNRPVAVVGYGPSAAAPALRVLLGVAIEELNPYDLAMGRAGEGSYGRWWWRTSAPAAVTGA